MKVLIVGATGSIGSTTVKMLLQTMGDVDLTVFSRSVRSSDYPSNVHVVKGNVLVQSEIQEAVKGKDIVFAALSGDLPKMAQNIITAMKNENVHRLIFISSMGIYCETADSRGSNQVPSILRPYRKAADLVEESGLSYTVIRPGWFDNGPVNYKITHKGEPFQGHDVSRQSVADLVIKIIKDPKLYENESVGIARA